RLDALAIRHVGKREAAAERAVLPLVEHVALAFLALLGAARAADGEDAVVDRDVEILLLDTGEVRLEHERVGRLLHLERGRECGRRARGEERVPVEQLASDRVRIAGEGAVAIAIAITNESHRKSSCA